MCELVNFMGYSSGADPTTNSATVGSGIKFKESGKKLEKKGCEKFGSVYFLDRT